MSKEDFYNKILAHAEEHKEDIDDFHLRYQLVSLWTVFCMAHELEPDTAEYDARLLRIWDILSGKSLLWGNFHEFDLDMGKFLA